MDIASPMAAASAAMGAASAAASAAAHLRLDVGDEAVAVVVVVRDD